jgi:hypothetical protein
MAIFNRTIFTYETLTALSLRLVDHAEALGASIEHEEVAIDLSRAAEACSRFATLQYRITEIASEVLNRPGLAIHRDIHEALQAAREG